MKLNKKDCTHTCCQYSLCNTGVILPHPSGIGWNLDGKYYGTYSAAMAVRDVKNYCGQVHTRCHHNSNQCCGHHDGCEKFTFMHSMPMKIQFVYGNTPAEIVQKATRKAASFFGVPEYRIVIEPTVSKSNLREAIVPMGEGNFYVTDLVASIKQ